MRWLPVTQQFAFITQYGGHAALRYSWCQPQCERYRDKKGKLVVFLKAGVIFGKFLMYLCDFVPLTWQNFLVLQEAGERVSP